jgi:phage terminase large subunit-like protein
MTSPHTNSPLSSIISERQGSAVLAEAERKLATKRLFFYKPYPKQCVFHEAGLSFRERLFLAGNQLGKTLAGGFEVALHLTGLYPDWWKGRVWDRPIVAWASGITGETTRDNPQRILLGRPEEWGTGAIPGDKLGEKTRALGVTDLLDNLRVRHVSGGESILYFKFYEKRRARWQGDTIDLVWFDEEPPPDIYSEGVTRTNATGGMSLITATPLLGMTEVVGQFYPEPDTPDRHLTQMVIDEAEHYSIEDRKRIVAGYPEHEREARAKGIPMLGSGRIFPVAEERIKTEAFEIPDVWARIGGMDFGWDHPFAAVEMVHDRDSDIVYVTKAHLVRQQTPILHAAALKPWGDWLPWSWPRDGRRETLEGAGIALAEQYRVQGLKMLEIHAQFEDKSVGVEAGLMAMLDRMQTGRLKVFAHLEDWFTEFRAYHRKDGLVVKKKEDLMCATRYGLMMLRFARTKPRPSGSVRPARKGAGGWMG